MGTPGPSRESCSGHAVAAVLRAGRPRPSPGIQLILTQYHSRTALPVGWRVLGGLGVPGPAGVPGRLVRGPLCRAGGLRGPGSLQGTDNRCCIGAAVQCAEYSAPGGLRLPCWLHWPGHRGVPRPVPPPLPLVLQLQCSHTMNESRTYI